MHLRNEVIARYRTVAVVGLSPRSDRHSHEVAQYLQLRGYRIIPVNPTTAGQSILGETCYPTLSEAASILAKTGVDIEIVNCFRRSEDIGLIADEAIAIGANCLWMQLDIVNVAAAARAEAAGLIVVMDRCLKIEHMRATSLA